MICPKFNTQSVKKLESYFTTQGVMEIYSKLQTPEFISWFSGDASIKTKEAADEFIQNNSINSINIDNDFNVGNIDNSSFLPLTKFVTLSDNNGKKLSSAELKQKIEHNFFIKTLEQRNEDTKNVNNRYEYQGKVLLHRATDFVKRFYESIFRNPNKEFEERAIILAKKGTVTHRYLELIGENTIKKVSKTLEEIRQDVIDSFKDNPDFKDLPEKFFSYTDEEIRQCREYVQNIIFDIYEQNPDAKIYTEFKIVDPEASVGATLDLVAFLSNGRVLIYDWKSMLDSNFIGEEDNLDLKEYKKQAFNIQLNKHREILVKSYNVKRENVETRAVPIIYSMYSDKKGNINVKKGFKEFNIGNYPEFFAFNSLTRHQDLNNIIDKMTLRRKSLETKLKKDRNNPKILSDLKLVDNILKEIHEEFKIDALYNNLSTLLLRFDSLFKNISENSDIDYIKDMANISNEISLYKSILEDISKYNESRKQDANFNYQENNEKIGILSKSIFNSESQITSYFSDYITNKLKSTGSFIDIKNITEGGFLQNFEVISDIQNPIIKALYPLVLAPSENEIVSKLRTFKETIKDFERDLNAYAKEKNMSLNQVISMFLNENKDFTGKFDKEYFKTKNLKMQELKSDTPKIRKEAIKWLKENSEFAIEDYENYKQKSFKVIEDTYFEDEALISKAKEDFEKTFDITKYESAYQSKNTFIRLKESDEKNLSEKYKVLKNDKRLLNIYNYFQNFNRQARRITGRDLKDNFNPNVQMSFAQAVSENGKSLSSMPLSLKEALVNSFTTSVEDDVVLGTINPDGTKSGNVPLYFTELFMPELSEQTKASIKEDLNNDIKKGIAEFKNLKENTLEYENELNRRIYKEKNKEAIKNKSSNFLNNYLLFAESVFSYEALNNRLDIVYALQNLLDASSHAPTNSTGNTFFNNNLTKIMTVAGVSKEDKELFEKVINQHIYGNKISSKDVTIKLSGGKKISAIKSINSIMSWFSLNVLGFKLNLAVYNAVQVRAAKIVLSREGVYMNAESSKKSILELTKDKDKWLAFGEFMGVDPRGLIDKETRTVGRNKLGKLLNTNTAFIGLTIPEELQSFDTLVSMSNFYRVVNNKIINPQKLWREGDTKETYEKRLSNYPTVYESIEKTKKENSDGTIDYGIKSSISEEELNNFRLVVRKVNSSITGNTSEYDKSVASGNIFLRILMQMRNWIPLTAKQRFAKTRIDIATNQIDVGRYAALVGEFSVLGADKVKTVLDLVKEIGLFGYNKDNIANRSVAEYYYTKWLERQFPNDIEKGKLIVPFEQYLKLRDNKLKAAAFEARIIILFMMVIAALSADWDDDGEENYKEFYGGKEAFKILNRSYNELTFFISPDSAVNITKGAVPVVTFLQTTVRLLNNTFDETRDFISIYATGEDKKGIWRKDTNDITPMLHYFLWFFPGVSNLNSSLNIDQELSEILGTQLEKKERETGPNRINK